MQRIINYILRLYRKFYKAYINNIVIFLIFLNKYIKYLNLIFKTLDSINIYLLSKKLFLDYLSIYLLNQKINALKLAITKEKLAIIL